MKPLLPFEDYIKEGTIKAIKPDIQRAKSLIKESERKLKSVQEILDKIGIKKENANDYVENCYDIIMYLIRAKLYSEGYTSKGKGAHEAEIAYLKTTNLPETDIRFANQMRYFRNGILYYGTILDKEYAEMAIKFLLKTYPKLKKMIEFQ